MRQKTVTERYRAVLEGKMAKSEFVRQMRQQYPMHVTQFNGFDDSVQILKNRGLLFEAPAEKKAKVYDERPALPYSDEAFQRGIRYELEAAGIAAHDAFNIKLEDFDKAKKKAEDMREQLRTLITYTRGVSAWQELIKMEGDIRKKRQQMIYDQKERQKAFIEVTLVVILLSLMAGLIGWGIWFIMKVKGLA